MVKDSIYKYYSRGLYRVGDYYSMSLLRAAMFAGKVSFNTKLLNPKYKLGQYETAFNEVSFADSVAFVPSEFRRVFNGNPETDLSYDEFILTLKNTLKEIIADFSDGKYLFLHSAGYDSRILSACMAELRDEGHDMDVHFRCHQPECEGFDQIMRAEGWPKEQYSCWEGTKEDYYDIGRDDISVNGFCPYVQQMNFWSDIVDNEKDYYLITGLGGEMYKYYGNNIKPEFRFCDNDLINLLIDHNPNKGEWENAWAIRFKDVIMPLWHYKYLSIASQARREWLKKTGRDGGDNIRLDLVKAFDYKIQNIKHGEHNYSWNLSQKRKERIRELFYDGMFYQHYKKYLPKKIDFTSNLYGWESRLWGFAVTVYNKLV